MTKRLLGSTTGWFLSTLRSASMRASDHSVRLAKVRLRIFLPSRQPSRSKAAGRELRFGTISIYMATQYHLLIALSSIIHGNTLADAITRMPQQSKGLRYY